MALGAEDDQAAQVGHAFAELDVRAAAGHVRGNRDGVPLSGARDDLGLLAVILGVEDAVRDFLALEHPAEHLGGLHAGRADEHRLAAPVAFLDLGDDGVVFLAARLVDAVVAIVAADARGWSG